MSLTDIRAEILGAINDDWNDVIMAANESADSDNVILLTDADGNRYKLTIEKL